MSVVFSRIELALNRSTLAGLVAALPWGVMMSVTLVLGQAQHPLLWLFCPIAGLGALRQFRNCGRLRGSRSVLRLSVTGQQLTAHLADGRCLPVEISTDSRLFARLAILKLKPTDTRVKPVISVLVDPLAASGLTGNVDPAIFRRLRVWIRLAASERATDRDTLVH